MNNNDPLKIGVFICHCGLNIAGTVNIPELAEFTRGLPHVAVVRDYKFMCSDPGQELIQKDIRELGLDRVVVAACTATMHGPTFGACCEKANLNRFEFYLANIREHCSWVSMDRSQSTQQAKMIVAGAVARVSKQEALTVRSVPVNTSSLVIGAGIAGITAALKLADAGYHVYLVEREPSIGGNMARLEKTFPTMDCSACILTPKMTQVRSHPNITLWTYSELRSLEGFVGNFKATIRRKPRYINEDLCVGCRLCVDACLGNKNTKLQVPDEFELGLKARNPIYMPFAQAVPQSVVIDPERCIAFRGKAGKQTPCKHGCVDACDRKAIDFTQTEREEVVEVGSVITTTGYVPYDPKPLKQYGYGTYANVYTGMELERILNAAGPTEGELTLRDGTTPKSVAIIHCVGSRDKNCNTHCSRVCCMYSLKLAHLIRERAPEAKVYEFYIDMRTPGKGYEEFYNRVREEGVFFTRGKPAFISDIAEKPEERGKLIVQSEDTLAGIQRRIPVDMVVLSTGLNAQADAKKLGRTLGLSVDANGFFIEKHVKLDPVATSTDGVFIAGCASGPKDIPDSVSQAEAAAAEVLVLNARRQVDIDPITTWIDPDICAGCKICTSMCRFGAITYNEAKNISEVNEALCKGCGTCVPACPANILTQRHYTDDQVRAQLKGILSHKTLNPLVIVFVCNWCSGAASELAGTSHYKYPANVVTVKVMCSGRIGVELALEAFKLGADGVLLTGCHEGDCRYEGNFKTIARSVLLEKYLEDMGVEKDRFRRAWASAGEAKHFADLVNDMVERVKALGPLNQGSTLTKEG